MSRPDTGTHRTGLEVLLAALALLAGWVALFGWRGLVEEPGRFLLPTLVGGTILAAAGVLLRIRHRPWWQVLVVQVALLAVVVDEHVSGHLNRWWVVPTPRSVEHTIEQLSLGGQALATEYSPVPATFGGVPELLLLGGLALLLSIDLLACGLRRVPLAGLPILVLWMFPISLLSDGLGWRVFAATSLLFVMLLATEEARRVLAWGRPAGEGRDGTNEQSSGVVGAAVLRSRAFTLGAVTCAAAVVLPVFVPLANHSFGPGSGDGSGPGDGSRSVTIEYPFVDLHRDLVKPETTPMVDLVTDARDPSYLRFTVLDIFSGVTWRPSARQLAGNTPANGKFPPAPGLSNRVDGRETTWNIRLLPTFTTSWLPTPYPVRSLAIDDTRWRYDPETLDVADREGDPFRGSLEYDVVAFDPDVSATDLHVAAAPPEDVQRSMTVLPDRLPRVITQVAQDVTAGLQSNYEKARALQDWFRTDGGFTYSLDRAPGNSTNALADFITEGKVGYCEQFAASFAVMARALDIPARVVVGFLRPEDRGEDRYRYTSDNLHAWPEVFFTGFGWVRFEPTPSVHTGSAPEWARQDLEGPTASPSPSAAPTTAPTTAPDRQDLEDGSSSGEGGGPGLLLWTLGLVLVLTLGAVPLLLRGAQRRRRFAAGTTPLEVANGLWAELRAGVHDRGLEWLEGRSVRRQATALLHRRKPDDRLARDIDALVLFVERSRYARPFAVSDAERASYTSTVEAWLDLLAATLPTWQRRRSWLFPRSVWSQPAALTQDDTAGPHSDRSTAEDDLVEVGR